MDLLETYMREIEADLKVDEFSIKDATLKAPGKKHFWVSRLIKHKRILIDLEAEKEDIKKRVIDEIQHQSPVKMTIISVERASDSSTLIRDINKKIKNEELIILFLEKTEKTMSSLTYDLKNVIEVCKLETT